MGRGKVRENFKAEYERKAARDKLTETGKTGTTQLLSNYDISDTVQRGGDITGDMTNKTLLMELIV